MLTPLHCGLTAEYRASTNCDHDALGVISSHLSNMHLQHSLQPPETSLSITLNSSGWSSRKTPMSFQYLAKSGITFSSNSTGLGLAVPT